MNRPVHFEILAEHPEKVASFYRSVFDWKIENWQGGEAYWLVDTGPGEAPGIHGAIMKREFPQAIINTVEVDSLEETLKKVEAAGGKKVHGPNQIPGIGIHAYCADPDGILFGVLEGLRAEKI